MKPVKPVKKTDGFLKNEKGDAAIEATFLFPIMIMIMAALVLLATYLPQAALLQRAVQYAATELMPEQTDMGYKYNADTMQTEWDMHLHNTWSDLFKGNFDISKVNQPLIQLVLWARDDKSEIKNNAEHIARKIIEDGSINRNWSLDVEVEYRKTLLYNEIEVTATRTVKVPIDLSFIGFPKKITITRAAVGVTKDGDGFMRNVDDAVALHDIVERTMDIVKFFGNLLFPSLF